MDWVRGNVYSAFSIRLINANENCVQTWQRGPSSLRRFLFSFLETAVTTRRSVVRNSNKDVSVLYVLYVKRGLSKAHKLI